MGQEGDLLVLDPDNEFFRYLNESDGGDKLELAVLTEILTALALLLIIEGMLPFVWPEPIQTTGGANVHN